jgi:hypothetical protein
MTCEAPFVAAPELFAWSESVHCYVKRQPGTADEVDRMLTAVHTAEAQCIRYRGADRLVQLRLLEAGDGAACDRLPPDLERLQDQRDRASGRGTALRAAAQPMPRLPLPSRFVWCTWSLAYRLRRTRSMRRFLITGLLFSGMIGLQTAWLITQNRDAEHFGQSMQWVLIALHFPAAMLERYVRPGDVAVLSLIVVDCLVWGFSMAGLLWLLRRSHPRPASKAADEIPV